MGVRGCCVFRVRKMELIAPVGVAVGAVWGTFVRRNNGLGFGYTRSLGAFVCLSTIRGYPGPFAGDCNEEAPAPLHSMIIIL